MKFPEFTQIAGNQWKYVLSRSTNKQSPSTSKPSFIFPIAVLVLLSPHKSDKKVLIEGMGVEKKQLLLITYVVVVTIPFVAAESKLKAKCS